ncbi:hypothetical protein KBB96_16265 [Luteolibacter ambystomatis]|uniref:Uncharacterized protein n=1 Tax=Luteolibacter ambystomatis TaxID=2824561 RepID=A0A975G8T4_9BACT|nr:hypothetical protein [Luteolibacter ambystomatis]QUE50410.1 hypothetical protein KBB96_16265 [Luteolibacter ambystomatis]
MDKEHARFVLRSFRPEGADAGDPDFAGALRLAAEDRELGEWLAGERARDAAFSDALGRVPIPADLREDILAGFAVARGELPLPHDDLDRAFISALAAVQPPPNLRADILAAMTAQPSAPVVRKPFPWFRIGLPVAAAAGVALAFLLPKILPGSGSGRSHSTVRTDARVPVSAVQAGFFKTFESPSFDLEQKDSNHQVLFRHLDKKDLPCPGCTCLPKGLENVPGIGCRELIIDGKRGSLICFNRGEDGIVHFIIFRREDIKDACPSGQAPKFSRAGEWSVATWSDSNDVYMLVGKTDVRKLGGLF